MSNALDDIRTLIAPYNKKGVAVTPETTFATDLEWDSLTVMDFVAEMEDHFDIIIPLNMLPDLETVGQVVDAVDTLIEKK
ncbi:acyl carrier protein [Iodidimonas sp. SYSU 1G8]|uniref:acyl carrier protein n=1 Tax=Iodidimonas sp. SYSU 1G8 TaxID=3133967 RepID=UPI0031FE550E